MLSNESIALAKGHNIRRRGLAAKRLIRNQQIGGSNPSGGSFHFLNQIYSLFIDLAHFHLLTFKAKLFRVWLHMLTIRLSLFFNRLSYIPLYYAASHFHRVPYNSRRGLYRTDRIDYYRFIFS